MFCCSKRLTKKINHRHSGLDKYGFMCFLFELNAVVLK